VLFFDGVGGLLVLALWIFCFIDVLVTPESSCRNLPKLAWVFIVLLVPFLGSIGWLVAGRPWDRPSQQHVSSRSSTRLMPTRTGAPARAMSPDDDEEFLAGLRKRAEEQRQRAREQQDGEQGDGGVA
jgi:Phospholipase_D-nuclease N-terminal